MKYYKITMDVTRKNDIVCHFDNDFGIEQNSLITGKVFDNWNSNFEFFYDSDEGKIPTDLLANDKGWFVISEKLKSVVLSLTDKVEFFEVRVFERKTQESIGKYFIANILNIVDALSLEDSDYFTVNTKQKGEVHIIKKYAVLQSKLTSIDIFKLPPNYNIPLFVSEKFKKIIEDEGLTGMDFLEIKVV